MEQEVEVKTFLIQYLCDDCNSIVIKDDKQKPNYLSDPMQFPYICPNCQKTYIFNENYPKTMYTWDKIL